MGKRKSKTGKQKQAKAAGKKFGVSVKKGRDQPKITMLSSSTSTVVVKKQDTNMGDITKKGFSPFPHRNNSKKNVSNNKLTRNQKKKTAQPANPTNNAFGKEMQSAQERSWVHHANRVKKSKMPTLAPATLIVDDCQKSMQRLMEEATQKVSTGMQGIGAGLVQQVRQEYPIGSTSNRSQLQSLAAQSEESPSLLETNNPWAALDQGDSDDDEQVAPPPPAPKLFQFAPPSFAMGNDVDPDL